MSDINDFIAQEALQVINKVKEGTGGIVTNIKKVNEEANKLSKTLETIDSKKLKLFADTQTKVIKNSKTLATEREKLNKVNKQLTESTDANVKAKIRYQKATKAQKDALQPLVVLENKEAGFLETLNARNKQLAASKDKILKKTLDGTKLTRAESKAVRNLNKGIDRNNALIRKNADALTRQKIGVGGYTRSILRAGGALLSVFGAGGGLFLAVRAFKATVKAGIEFERVMSKVRAISGATTTEFRQLRKNARNLGESTEKTAIEVAGLQVELAKLGLTSGQILKVTGNVLDLSTAAGSDLAQSAKVAAATMKGFNLEADQMKRITDVMAKSFSSSALDLAKFENAMAKVAPVAKNANKSIEATTAELSLLVDRGLEASIAGTSLRNIYLTLAEKGLSMNKAFEMINNSSNKNAQALELFGKRGAVAAIILAENQKQADILTKSYENSAGAAKRMADIMRENLKGDADEARSAIEGLSLNLFDRMNPALRGATQGFTGLISSINDYLKIPTSEKIAEEGKEVNSLLNSIIALDEESRTRAELIGELNAKYPEILGNLSAEESSNRELIKLQKQYNSELRKRIKLSVFTDEITEKEEEAKEAFKAELAMIRSITATYDKYIQNRKKGATLQEQIAALQDREQFSLKAVTKEWAELADATGAVTQADVLSGIIEGVNIAQEKYNKSLSEQAAVEAEIEKITQSKNKVLKEGVTIDNINLLTLEQLKNLKFEDIEVEKERVKLLNERIERQRLIDELNKQATDAPIGKTDAQIAKDAKKAAKDAKTKKAAEDAKKAAEDAKKAKALKLKTDISNRELKRQLDYEIIYANSSIKNEQDRINKTNELTKQFISDQITNINSILENEELSTERRIELEQELADKKLELAQAEFDASEKKKEQKEAADEEKKEKDKEVASAAIALAQEANAALFTIFNDRLTAESRALEVQKQFELELAGDDAKAKEAINTKFAKKQAELKRKQAINDKLQALFSIGINTAVAIVGALASAPPNIILAAIVGAIGLASAITVAAKPIPKFEKGGKPDTNDPILWGDKGRELGVSPSGDLVMANKPTISEGMKGYQIFNNAETEQLFSAKPAGYDSTEIKNTLIQNNKDLIKAIKEKKETHIDLGKGTITDREGHYYKTYVNSKFG